MRFFHSIPALFPGSPQRWLAIACVCFVFASAANAQAPDDARYVDAAARSFGFLESAPRTKAIGIGVVYDPSEAGARDFANSIAQRLAKSPGSHRLAIDAKPIDLGTLGQAADGLVGLYLLPGEPSQSAVVRDVILRRRLVAVSTDSACLSAHTCVLHVEAGRSVSIVLDTKLAEEVGARFSTVFSMMVTRK
jgi:alkanesulfonate monooxygenase SsuD/methylene tetrahydromethanopterin reductase-like flavin-dependent oxidoreductase (luciferase family)